MTSADMAVGMVAGANVAQWIAAIFSGGTFLAVLRFVLGWRSQSMTAEEQIRDHYANEVAALRGHLRDLENHYRGLLKESDEKHEACQRDRDELRQHVTKLEDKLRGITRQISQYSADRLTIMEDNGATDPATSPHAHAAAKRVKKLDNGRR